jgi:hypothetical protein
MEELKNGLQARAHAESIYETDYLVDDCGCRMRMRKPQRSAPKIRATLSRAAAA